MAGRLQDNSCFKKRVHSGTFPYFLKKCLPSHIFWFFWVIHRGDGGIFLSLKPLRLDASALLPSKQQSTWCRSVDSSHKKTPIRHTAIFLGCLPKILYLPRRNQRHNTFCNVAHSRMFTWPRELHTWCTSVFVSFAHYNFSVTVMYRMLGNTWQDLIFQAFTILVFQE